MPYYYFHTVLLISTSLFLHVLLLHAQDHPDSLLQALFPSQTCPISCQQWTPCCSGGYCRKEPLAGCLISEGCDPNMSFDGKCIPVPMCKSYRDDFIDPKSLIDKSNFVHPDMSNFWREYSQADNAYIENGNLVLELKWSDTGKEGKGGGQGATIPSIRFAQYGEFSARIKAATGVGVVNSFITKTSASDALGDELDFEFLGSNTTEVQTNYYINGHIDHTRADRYRLPNGQNTDTDYHIYTIDWKPDRTRFLVDGIVIRSFTPSQVKDDFPRHLMRVWFSVWDAGCNMPEGTVTWAGGETDWCKDVSKRNLSKKMYVDWVEFKCVTEDLRPASAYYIKIPSPDSGSDNDFGSSNSVIGGGLNGGVRSSGSEIGNTYRGDVIGTPSSQLGTSTAMTMITGFIILRTIYALLI